MSIFVCVQNNSNFSSEMSMAAGILTFARQKQDAELRKKTKTEQDKEG